MYMVLLELGWVGCGLSLVQLLAEAVHHGGYHRLAVHLLAGDGVGLLNGLLPLLGLHILKLVVGQN